MIGCVGVALPVTWPPVGGQVPAPGVPPLSFMLKLAPAQPWQFGAEMPVGSAGKSVQLSGAGSVVLPTAQLPSVKMSTVVEPVQLPVPAPQLHALQSRSSENER